MRKKKSQVAMEFLMTYGWVILVAIIVVGVLRYLIGNPANLVGNNFKLSAPLVANSWLYFSKRFDALANFTTTNNAGNLINQVQLNNSISLHSFDASRGGIARSNSMGTGRTTISTNLHFQRSRTVALNVEYQIVQFPFLQEVQNET